MTARLILAAAAILALAGCGSSSNTTTTTGSGAAPRSTTTASSTSHASGLTVTPSVGSPRSVIRFGFVAPPAATESSGVQLSYALSVSGPRGSGCVGVHGRALPRPTPGEHVSTSLGPAQLGGSWCPGTYTARVEELARPVCASGQMCPQFIRVTALIGPATFRISG